MSIEITARHLKISKEMQDFAREKAAQLKDDFPKVEHIHVILDEQRHLFSAEFVLQIKALGKVEAKEENEKLPAAIELAFEKVDKQLRKHRQKVVTNHQRA